VCLELPDGGLDLGSDAQTRAVVGVIRQARPRVVLLPHPDDPHPDHLAAAAIVRKAAFQAGVARCLEASGQAHRPRMLLAYPGPRQVLSPDLVVDVTGTYASKRAALACYASQFRPDAGPPTHLASGYYLAAIEGRDRAYGNAIEAELGEAFAAVGPLSASEVAWLVTAGE
jgi:LmbE family N-acetylglucosaminyl deacetylase